MKRYISILLAATLIFGILTGCESSRPESPFESSDEIFTYQRVDPEKTQIVVSRIGNIPVEQLCNAFEEKNPDIQIVYLDITGGNGDYSARVQASFICQRLYAC